VDEHPSLNIAVARLSGTEPGNYAVWVLKAPYPGGYTLENTNWNVRLTQIWLAWQELFSPGSKPYCLPCHQNIQIPPLDLDSITPMDADSPQIYSSRLMQGLGLNLWQWLFSGQVGNAFAQSRGISLGQNKLLRLRMEVRDPDLIALPWDLDRSAGNLQPHE
jgi:hypothetical protein